MQLQYQKPPQDKPVFGLNLLKIKLNNKKLKILSAMLPIIVMLKYAQEMEHVLKLKRLIYSEIHMLLMNVFVKKDLKEKLVHLMLLYMLRY